MATPLAFLGIALLASLLLLFKELRVGRIGGIAVNSHPEGAEVWYAGQRVGNTPCEFRKVPPGEFVYSLVLTNYESITITNYLVAKKQMNDFAFLRRVELTGERPPRNLSTNLTELRAFASQQIPILQIQGDVQVAISGRLGWTLAQTNEVISVGDRLRTGPRSHAALRWLDNSVVRLGDSTEVEILPQGTKLNAGSMSMIYILNTDGTSNAVRVITSGATAAIEG